MQDDLREREKGRNRREETSKDRLKLETTILDEKDQGKSRAPSITSIR